MGERVPGPPPAADRAVASLRPSSPPGIEADRDRSAHRITDASPYAPLHHPRPAPATAARHDRLAHVCERDRREGASGAGFRPHCAHLASRVMRVVLLAGGVGGAKMADGLAATVGPDLTVIVNTGDDLELHGLAIWPDHDTVAYTLAGLDDEVRGWGLRGESWTVMDRLEALGEGNGSGSATAILPRTSGAQIACGPAIDRPRSRSTSRLPWASRHASCRWPTSRSGPRSAQTTAGWSSRSTSCIATRSRPSTRSASEASRTPGRRQRCWPPSKRPRSSSSRHQTRWCRSTRSWASPGCATRSLAHSAVACRSSRSAASSVARHSRDRPIGCSRRSVRCRARSA